MIPFRSVLDLVTAGEAFDDFVFHGLPHLPRAGEELRTAAFGRSPGGGAVITAIAASRLGARCGAMTAIAAEAARTIRAERVRLWNLLRANERPALSVALSTERDRSFVTFDGVNQRLASRLLRSVASVRARHVHLAFAPSRCRPWITLVESLRRRNATSSWDFGWNPWLPRDRDFRALATSVDYLFMNRPEAVAYAQARTFRRALDRWRMAPNLVVIKLGAAGGRIVGRGADVRAPACRARVVDTTGAGDAFNAGFLVGRLHGWSIERSLALANRVGARSTRAAGGIAALPRLKVLA